MAAQFIFFEGMRMKKPFFIRTVSVLLAFLLMLPTAFAAVRAEAAQTNEREIYNYLAGVMGLNNAAACGVLANIEIESGFDPHAVGDGGTSYGICQWHNSRFTALRNYCAANALDYTTLNGQLRFLQYELERDFPKTTKILREAPNTAAGAYEAGYQWCYRFEVPAGYASGVSVSRGNLAKNIYWPVYADAVPQTPLQQAAAEAKNSPAFRQMLLRIADMIRAVLSLISAKKG